MFHSYEFQAQGHENILGTHRNTLEFTKDASLSKDGDCIVGLKSNFSINKLKPLLEYKKLKMTLSSGKIIDTIRFIPNPEFNSDHEMVIRISDFRSGRTFGIRSDKSSAQLSRKLIDNLKSSSAVLDIKIEPQIKAIIMDFDDTIEDWQIAKQYAYEKLSEHISKKFKLSCEKVKELLYDLDVKKSKQGVNSSPNVYDRHIWFSELFKKLNLNLSDSELNDLVDLHWAFANEKVRMMPHAIEVLKELKKKYLLVVMSDSDGSKEIKLERMQKLGVDKLFDLIVTSDDIGQNKPNKKFYEFIFSKFDLSPEDCMMMGDKPEVDLNLAKLLGLKTVWVKHGDWAEHETVQEFDYINYTIESFDNFFKDVDIL